MRKSSFGTRRPSQPTRLDPDELRASSSRRTLDSRSRGSGIPQPNVTSKGRRSSSENRNSRSTYLPPSMKRSKSQINIVTPAQNTVTPIRVPPNLPFGSAGSQRFSPYSDGGRSSRKSSQCGVGPGKPGRVLKDTRPLSDKAFQQQQIQKITSFIYSQPSALEFAPKGLNLRQLTMKLFVDIVNYLMGFLDELVCVNMTNYVTEIPLIMKKWGYVGNVNASWLKTVNTPHALPHVLGLLSWLTTLAAAVASTDYDYVVQDALQNDEDAADESFPYGNAAVYLDHLITQYRHWNTGDEVSERNEETRFIVDLCNRNGVGDNEMQQLRETVQNLEIQLNDPKELAEIEAAKAEEIKYNTVLNDYRNTLAYKNQMEDLLNSAETTLEEERSKLEKEEAICKNLQNSILDLKDQLTKQVMTVEERDDIEKLCRELNSTIREHEEYIAAVSNQIYADDLDMVKKREVLKKKTQSFNKIIVMESCWLPELQALRDETNPLHQDAKERFAYIDAAARKLKSDLQKKREELNSAINELKAELLQTEERKSLVLDEVEQWTGKVKQQDQAVEAIKMRSTEETAKLKKTIDTLKLNNEAHITDVSVEKAKEELQRLIEKREFGKAHIEKLKLKAEDFFKKSANITLNFMTAVNEAEAAHIKKRNELFLTLREKVQKVKTDVNDLM